MDEINNKIKASGWAERTIKSRLNFIKSLKANIDPDSNNMTFLKNFAIVSKYILSTTKNPATVKTKILTIKSILNLYDEKAANKYEKLAHTVINNAEEYKGNNIAKSPNKVISYEEMLEIPYLIEKEIKSIYDNLFLSTKEIDNLNNIKSKNKYFKLLTNYIISVLYCWEPPVRADWGVTILKPSKTENWYSPNKGIIHWQDFKNVRTFGSREFKLDPIIKDNVNEYISILDYIFNESGKIPLRLLYMVGIKNYTEFTREKFSIYFTRLMKKYTNKDISINSLRHTYENYIIKSPDYNKLTINDKKKIHERLLHNFSTAQEYLTV